jgi:hypothetical protein
VKYPLLQELPSFTQLTGLNFLRQLYYSLEDFIGEIIIAYYRISIKNVNDSSFSFLLHFKKQKLLQRQCFYSFLDWVVIAGLSLNSPPHFTTLREDALRYLVLEFMKYRLVIQASQVKGVVRAT